MGAEFIDLLKKRQFLPFFLTQFFSAFNDNAFKLAMLTLISYRLSTNQAQSELYQALAGALFILPFFMCSATSGQLADKYDKAIIARLVKIFEVVLIIMGSVAFYKGSIFFMMITLTGMGIHSAFFGPIKYALLPSHLPQEELLGATSLIEASTFLAILLGTTLGTLAISISATPLIAVCILVAVALAGLVSSLFIPQAPSYAKDLKIDFNFWRATVTMLKQVHNDSGTLLAILTISWFWLVGAVLLTKLPDYTHYVLGANTIVFAVFLGLFSTGIALGSLLINRVLRGRITLAVVPWIMLLFTVFTFDLYWTSPATLAKSTKPLLTLLPFFSYFVHWHIAFDLFMLAVSAGLFVVPLYTFLQIASRAENRARTIAANNIYNSLFMVLGTLLVMLLLHLQVTIAQVFLILSILNSLVAVFLLGGLLYKKRKGFKIINLS